MADGSVKTRQQGLQQAASVIFALVAIVPLLIFAWTLHSLGVIRSTQAQLSLGLALGIALLGFWMFRSMLGRMAEVVQALAAAVEQANRARRPLPAAAAPAGPAAAATPPETAVTAALATQAVAAATVSAPAVATNGVAAAASPASPAPAPLMPAVAPRPAAVPRPAAAPASRQARAVPGIGKIRELTEVVRTMDALWHREASAHLGKRVQISVANSREPLTGTLSEASADGLILDQDDGSIAVAYGRVTSIDRLT